MVIIKLKWRNGLVNYQVLKTYLIIFETLFFLLIYQQTKNKKKLTIKKNQKFEIFFKEKYILIKNHNQKSKIPN